MKRRHRILLLGLALVLLLALGLGALLWPTPSDVGHDVPEGRSMPFCGTMPEPVHPLTRLRRTLARLIPALRD